MRTIENLLGDVTLEQFQDVTEQEQMKLEAKTGKTCGVFAEFFGADVSVNSDNPLTGVNGDANPELRKKFMIHSGDMFLLKKKDWDRVESGIATITPIEKSDGEKVIVQHIKTLPQKMQVFAYNVDEGFIVDGLG